VTGSTGSIDLAARRLGGMVVSADDEFFGAKEHLLEPLPPTFDPAAYGDRGKVVDGWETRRRRSPGSDRCVVRLGVPGVPHAVVIDTTFFRGNHPAAVELHGAALADLAPDGAPHATAGDPAADDGCWLPLLDRTDLRADAVQRFALPGRLRVSHVRLTIHPDGGVARLRVLGHPLVDLHRVADPEGRLDLAAITSGGRPIACSDAFYSDPANLLGVGDGRDMGDGWETRRRRGPGQDWAVVRLATTGVVERVEVDTTNFKGNHPDRVAVQVVDDAGMAVHDGDPARSPWTTTPDGWEAPGWTTLVAPTPMRPHARHRFDVPPTTATHLRVVMIPDGGLARLRVHGRITEDGWRRAGLAHLDALPADRAEQALLACCGSTRWAAQVAAGRPFVDVAALQATALDVWRALGPDDHLEAVRAHPRIGGAGTGGAGTGGGRSAGWSAVEQAGAATADAATARAIAERSAAYERRFGHLFLIRAAGRSAHDVLAALDERLGNDADVERGVVAAQQAEITALRLDRMLLEGP
jgi:allantoicase